MTAAYYYIGKDITFYLDTAVPFGLNSRQHVAWWMHGEAGRRGDGRVLRDYGVVGHLMGGTGAQMGGWYRKEIKTVEDPRGPQVPGRRLCRPDSRQARSRAQQIPGGDIYPALEKGTIDAAEWVGPYDDEKLGFYKVARRIVTTPAGGKAPAWVRAYINQKSWSSLPPLYQKAIETTANRGDALDAAR